MVLAMVLASSAAHADDGVTVKSATDARLTIGGYIEAFWQWNFNDPANGVTSERAFDNRHDSFTLDNAAIDLLGAKGPVTAHLVLQAGNVPQTYYAAEPAWQHIQQANLGYTTHDLLVEGGVFLSPIGPESIPNKDQWNWSRSNLFLGLPFYHAGVRATYPVTGRWSLSAQLYNGWNDIADNNRTPSPALVATYTVPGALTWQTMYFGGVERATGAPEGQAWRHLVDTYASWTITPATSVLAQVDAGFERNHFGTSSWVAGAAYVRQQLAPWLYAAARADYFHETVPAGAAPIFWAGSRWVSSGTLTLDVRPEDTLSVRLEFRHDQSQRPLYDAHRHQDTLTVGAVAWF